MIGIRTTVVRAAVLAMAAGTVGAPPAASGPLPARMADTGGGNQLITAEALAALREVAGYGGRIAYAEDPSLATFQVVA